MFEGLRLVIPMLLVMAATLVLGGILAGTVWLFELIKPQPDFPVKVRQALIVFSGAVVSVIVGSIALVLSPREWHSAYVFDEPFGAFILLLSLAVSLCCEIFTIPLTRKFRGRGSGLLMVGSCVLIGVNLLGLALYWLSGPGMPLY